MRGRWVYLVILIYGAIAITDGIIGDILSSSGRIFLLVFCLMVGVVVYYFDFYNPLDRWKQSKCKIQISFILELVVTDLQNIVKEGSVLRANVMLAKKRFLFWGWRDLTINFNTDGYTEAEKEQRYKKDVGCCGSALVATEQIWFDSKKNQIPYKGMSATQLEVTNNIESILSTPVFSPSDIDKKNPIGILNIDSINSIDDTHFDDEDIQNRTARFAALIGSELS